jgi:hypothetical protein
VQKGGAAEKRQMEAGRKAGAGFHRIAMHALQHDYEKGVEIIKDNGTEMKIT